MQDEEWPRDVQNPLDGLSPSPARASSTVNTPSVVFAQLERYRANISILARCKWALRGKGRVQSLIKNLREYNDNLIRLCSWEAQMQMNRGLHTVALPGHTDFVDLHMMADAAEDTATDETSPSYEGRQRLANMARFRAKITSPPRTRGRWYKSRNNTLDHKAFWFHPECRTSTLAIHKRDNTVVLIEWRDYSNEPEEEQIHILSDLLCASEKPAEFRTLPCLGIFRQSLKSRYGLVYKLPPHIRKISRPLQQRDLSVRKPISLADLIKKIKSPIPLGLRFRLAQRLISSVIVIHGSGWLHKTIHPGNIIFFPAELDVASQGQLEGRCKDVGRPYIVGYSYSRPDDVVSDDVAFDDMMFDDMMSDHKGKRHSVSKRIDFADMYRHPDKAEEPARRFRHTYDIYSLGLVLLEIGLWRNLGTFMPEKGLDPPIVSQKLILTQLVSDLWGQCGAIYGEVVKECLSMRSDDDCLEEESQRKLCWDIAERLDRCVA